MESKYNYFKRDISWLSFNYRVLLEALDERLPLYERINFISIYSSNLEEFYKIRVADHKAVASGATESDEETVQSARELVEEINKEVTRQLDDRVRIYEEKLLPALRKNHIIFYQDRHVEPFHQQFIKDFFREECFGIGLRAQRFVLPRHVIIPLEQTPQFSKRILRRLISHAPHESSHNCVRTFYAHTFTPLQITHTQCNFVKFPRVNAYISENPC